MLHQRGGLVYHQMMMIQKRLSFFTAHNNLFVTFCGRFVLLNAHQMTLAYLFHDLKESSFCNQFDFNSFRINAKKSIPQLHEALAIALLKNLKHFSCSYSGRNVQNGVKLNSK